MPKLTESNKTELRKLFKRLVRQVRPSDLDQTVSGDGSFFYFADSETKKSPKDQVQPYCRALMLYMGKHPHILSGERFDDPQKTRITPTGLTEKDDKKWFVDTLQEVARDYRFKEGMDFKSRVIKEPKAGWVTWATTDCCFAAILRKINVPDVVKNLGVTNQYFAGFKDTLMNRTPEGKKALAALTQVVNLYAGTTESIALERSLEEELAGFLEIPRRAVHDETLIFLLESRLGWKRMPGKTLADLNADASAGKSYILSYLADAPTDFWHIVLATRAGNSWTIVDRQKARDGKEEKIPADLTTNADAWEIDEDSTQYKAIVERFRARYAETKAKLEREYNAQK